MRQIGYGLLLLIIIGLLAMGASYISQQVTPGPSSSQVEIEETQPLTFAFRGRDGTDALSLMKELTDVQQDNNGLVISINGRRADTANREYWAMYVNDTLSQTGPAEYITKSDDSILWKIEKY